MDVSVFHWAGRWKDISASDDSGKKNLVTLPELARGWGLNVNQGHLSADPLGLSYKTVMQLRQIQRQSLSLHLTYQLSVPVFTHMTQQVLEVYCIECL